MKRQNWNLFRQINDLLTSVAIVLGVTGLVYGESFSLMTPIIESESPIITSSHLIAEMNLQSETETHNDVSGSLKEPLTPNGNSTPIVLKPSADLSVPSATPSDLNNNKNKEQPRVLNPPRVERITPTIQRVNATMDSSHKEIVERAEYQEQIPGHSTSKTPSTLPDPDLNLPEITLASGTKNDKQDSTSSCSEPVNRETSAESGSIVPATPIVPEAKELVEKPIKPDTTVTSTQVPAIALPVPVSVPVEQNTEPPITPVMRKSAPPAYVPKNGEVDGANPQIFRDDYDYMQLRSELLGEIEKHAWKSGDFQIIPYGYFWASVSYESNPTQIGSCPFYVKSPDNTGNQTHVDYRGSIFGANILGPKIAMFGDAKIRAKIEFDLQRTIDYENKTSLHLRHCYVEAMNEQYRILIGQTWDVVSPLAPGTLMYSAGWQDGNVGYRRAQVRLERFYNIDPHFQIKFQGCLSAPFAGEGTDELNLCGEKYRIKDGSYPIIQGRVATVLGCRKTAQKPIEFGISGHIGEIQYGHINAGYEDNNYKVKTWGIYLDGYLPINQYIGFQGELFKGENLAMFLGGIGQGAILGYDKTPEAVKAQGGWLSMWVNLTEKSQFRIGYMIDDPFTDVSHLETDPNFSARTLNHSLFTNVKYNITPQWWVGAEYSHIETTWAGQNSGVSRCDRVDLVSYFGF